MTSGERIRGGTPVCQVVFNVTRGDSKSLMNILQTVNFFVSHHLSAVVLEYRKIAPIGPLPFSSLTFFLKSVFFLI